MGIYLTDDRKAVQTAEEAHVCQGPRAGSTSPFLVSSPAVADQLAYLVACSGISDMAVWKIQTKEENNARGRIIEC